jgi:hypothetical protein
MPDPSGPSTRFSASLQSATRWLALLGVVTISACEDRAPTAPATMAAQAVPVAPDAAISAQGTIGLPINQTGSTAAPNPLFALTQKGTGPNGQFSIANNGSSAVALFGQTNGSGIAVRGLATGAAGRAGSFEITNSGNIQDVLFTKASGIGYALHAIASGNGGAAKFENTKAGNGSNTLYAFANGGGNAISAVNTGAGTAGSFSKTGTGGTVAALFVQSATGNPVAGGVGGAAVQGRQTGNGPAGLFETKGANNKSPAVEALSVGGPGGYFKLENASSSEPALYSQTTGTGWAGHFVGKDHGVLILTASGEGLQVVNGTKNAVVGTATGARDLYTEESSEVWFTDYGFGRTEHGRARILLDPTFAQTINTEEPYHVFLEEYGDAQLYVAQRTSLGFVVQSHGGADIDFSFRVVARRRGFETQRLERAPWADASSAFTDARPR